MSNGDLIKLVEDTNSDAKEVVLSEAYQLFESQMMNLAEKYKNGEMTKEQYQEELTEIFGSIKRLFTGDKPQSPEEIKRAKDIRYRTRSKREKAADAAEFKKNAEEKLKQTQQTSGIRPGVRQVT